MRRGWDEIRRQAKQFAESWKDAHYEKGEAQTFYNEFFQIFGVPRRQVASFEKRVENLDKSRRGFIDILWPGTFIAEHKSAGLDLGKAQSQMLDYFDWLPDRDKPQFTLTCDFQRWRLTDMETGKEIRFKLSELPKHIEHFAFILGRRRSFGTQAAVNITAAELMGRLHDALEADNYAGHDLERLLVRLLFCLFADDTGIFEPKDIFLQLIEEDMRSCRWLAFSSGSDRYSPRISQPAFGSSASPPPCAPRSASIGTGLGVEARIQASGSAMRWPRKELGAKSRNLWRSFWTDEQAGCAGGATVIQAGHG